MSKENKDKIRALSDREQSREKISIFYGSSSNYQHGLKEIIANSTDEVINNYEDGQVTVELFEDLKTVSITDTGRGIPIGGETDGIKNYDLLFTTLFASTKYEENEKTTTGTNGVGATVLNFTSKLFKVESWSNGKKHTVEFINGGEIVDGLKEETCSKEKHGTRVTFKLDEEVYPRTKYDKSEVEDIVKRFAVGSPKVKLSFIHNGETTEFHYETVEEYFDEIVNNTRTSPIITSPETEYDDDDEINKIKVVFSTATEPVQESYLNLTYLSEYGTFHDGIVSGIRNFVSKYCRDNNLFPKNIKSFMTSDIESSVSYVCVALSNKVEFQNQTKLSTNKQLYKKIADKHVKQLLQAFMVEDEKGFKKFINHLLAVQKHNSQSLRAKQQLKKKLNEKVDGIGNRVENLVDSKKHGKDSELFIAEGHSALGSIVLARDAIFQAAYPLRGKILNCLKADYPTIFKNQIITDLVKVLGCGIQADRKNKDLESFNIEKLRYGKIIISTDADPDGHQIACLIITMFYRLMPELLNKGHIYIAQTPLYEVKLEDDSMLYFFSEKEKDEELPKVKGKYVLARCKGLGELDAETMAETAMDDKTRNLVRVTVEDAKMMIESLETWMGIDGANRKDYISENLHLFVEDVI